MSAYQEVIRDWNESMTKNLIENTDWNSTINTKHTENVQLTSDSTLVINSNYFSSTPEKMTELAKLTVAAENRDSKVYFSDEISEPGIIV